MEDSESCYSPGSIAGAIIGTFLTTCLLLAVTALLYRRWRRNKGKHLVLVTDPEIVEEAYAFDNPCFKDASTPAGSLAAGRSLERPLSSHLEATSVSKDGARWTTPWSNLGRAEKRRTLDDSVVGPKASRVSRVGLRSRDFTGLGFNVCGNMREGIFVKDLLHRGPASESGRIHPGDRIISVKISFRSMVYEDALTILSYASPYDVELEVESGGHIASKPATLLKKSVGPGPAHICHPLYRSQSIPELSQGSSAKKAASSRRLFAADVSDSNATMNSTLKSSKSSGTSGNQSLERKQQQHHHEDKGSSNHQPKFGIKVLPALDGTVHRVENQNEHNTNLERRHSRKMEAADKRHSQLSADEAGKPNGSRISESLQQRSVGAIVPEKKLVQVVDAVGIDVPDRAAEIVKDEDPKPKSVIPSEVPAEVHNAAMAARRNRKSSGADVQAAQKVQQQLLDSAQTQSPPQETADGNEGKSPQKGKRKAPAPPSRSASIETNDEKTIQDEKINSISDYKEPERTSVDAVDEKVTVKEEPDKQPDSKPNGEPKLLQERSKRVSSGNRRTSESDTDSEIQHSFTTIELNPADITVHHTPVPESAANDDDDNDADDVYRKAASLGDLSKYENKASAATLERAQSLDMTDTGSKKRKAPMPPPEDIHESTEDLTKLDQIEAFADRRKLKKSSEWGTLEDAIWSGQGDEPPQEKTVRSRKKSGGSGAGTLERSKSNVEIKSGEAMEEISPEPLNVSDGAIETSLELYNLPLSKKLTQDFIRAERLFDPDEDNALARIVHDGEVIKSPTAEEVEKEFVKSHPLPKDEEAMELSSPEVADTFEKAVRLFDEHTKSPAVSHETKVSLPDSPEDLYAGRKEVVEEPMSKVTLNFDCPGCNHRSGKHAEGCSKKKTEEPEAPSYHRTIRVEEPDNFETHFAKPIVNVPKSDAEDEEEEAGYEFGSAVTVNNKNNVSNISVSSGENSEDSGLVRESMEFKAEPPQKMTYITEIKVSPNRADVNEDESNLSENEEIVSILESSKKSSSDASPTASSSVTITANGKLPAGKKPPVPPRRSDATRYVPRSSLDEKQVVYVSEYNSPAKESEGKNWVFVKDVAKEKQQEVNPWGNGASQSQPVTNIVLSSSGDEKIIRK